LIELAQVVLAEEGHRLIALATMACLLFLFDKLAVEHIAVVAYLAIMNSS